MSSALSRRIPGRVKQRVAQIAANRVLGRILLTVFPETVPVRGRRFVARCLTPVTAARLVLRLYERAELDFVDKYLRPDLDVIELGASLGVTSVEIANRLDPDRKLVCVEADPSLISCLRTNLDANGASRATVVHAAIGYARSASFLSGGSSTTGRTTTIPVAEGTGVNALSLSQVVADLGTARYALVADIEGAELEILANDLAALERCDQIIIELHGGALSADRPPTITREVREILEGIGFSLRATRGPVVVLERSEDLSLLRPSTPSFLLQTLVSYVRSGRLVRGYGRLLQSVPTALWGGELVLATTDVGDMAIPLTEPSGFSLLFFGNLRHEAGESAVVSRLARSCGTFVDIGAHYGWYSRVFTHAQPHATVLAVEPDPYSAAVLRYNLRAFPSARVIEAAIGPREGLTNLWRASSRDLNSTVRETGQAVEVAVTTLDRLCDALSVSSVDFVKCDVEGGEAAVLQGAQTLLRRGHSPIWLLEVIEGFANEARVNIDSEIADVFRNCDNDGVFFSCNNDGSVDPIDDLAERRSNNVFWVPRARLQQFHHAVEI